MVMMKCNDADEIRLNFVSIVDIFSICSIIYTSESMLSARDGFAGSWPVQRRVLPAGRS